MAGPLTRRPNRHAARTGTLLTNEEITPDPVETAVGTVIGLQPGVDPLPRSRRAMVRAEMERAILGALQRPPCIVAFSGGRDSSAILAVACAVARREQLPLPLPVTLTFPDNPDTFEDDWQNLVISHLGLTEWIRQPAKSPDNLGHDAMALLRQIGVRFPPNAYMSIQTARHAAGGSFLSGIGGDEVLGSPAPTWLRLLAGRERPSRAAVRVAVGELRGGHLERQARAMLSEEPWVRRPTADEAVARIVASAGPRYQVIEDVLFRQWTRTRYYQACYQTIQRLCTFCGSEAVTPLLEPGVMAAVGAEAGISGIGSRTEAMVRFFGDLLPPELLQRRTKAHFTRSVAAESTRAFVAQWDGSGVDTDLVDPDVLREVWSRDEPDFRSGMLLQQAALATGWMPD